MSAWGRANPMSHPGQVHSSERLLQEVWGYPPSVGAGSLVRAQVKNLREEIEPDPCAPRCIRTVQRHGYVVGE